MKKRVLSAMLVAAMAMTAIPSQTFAEGAAQQTGKLSYDGYTEVWGDEFDGDSLNRDDWNVETHEKGWVNNELQEYVDSADNIQVKAGKLVINPVKKVTDGDTGSTKEAASYTSGRVSTQNKQTFTYGRFECRAKVPKSQGTYTITDGADFSDDFHIYTCDWEPGKITWYVDGVKYHEESDWYSTTVGQGTLTYPAPFDQPFYIILNLAVGGSWVGNPNDETSFENNPYVIDYVRVYQKDSYNEDVKRPPKEVTLRDPDANGNYINNGDFSANEDLSDGKNWKFITALEGDAEASIDYDTETKTNTMTIKTEKEGTVDYSVQLVQADLPFEKGATYQVQFDAYASADREMGVDVKAPDHGYMSYMPHQDVQLTTKNQTYTYEFKMGEASDANGRLEYNMGAKVPTADIYISNVSVKKIKPADPNEKEEKTVLANGNYVYNGSFQEGDKHLGYWTVTNADNADVAVTSFADGRRLKATMSGNEKSAVVISQEDLAFATGTPYRFSFTVSSDADNTITANVGGHVYTCDVKAGERKDFAVELPSDIEYANHNIAITLGSKGTTWLDNVSLVENALVKNGSFNDGTTGYTVYVDSSARASYVVDSLKDDNALAVTINDTGDADWKVQIKQENIKLEKGKTYKLKFKAKSSLNRKIRVVMQGQENRGWDVYSNDNIVNLTDKYQTFEDTFTMNKDTDTAAFFSACLGAVEGNQITTQHEVHIDDISLEEVKDDSKEDIKDNPKDDPKEDIKDNPKDDPKQDIKDNPKDDPKEDIKDNPKDDPKEDIKDNSKDNPKQDIKTDIKNEQPKVPAPVIKTSDSDKVKTTQAVKESKTAKAAKTGDNSPIMVYVFGAMAGALILGVSFLKKRKNTNN